jgi:hypothetical protein
MTPTQKDLHRTLVAYREETSRQTAAGLARGLVLSRRIHELAAAVIEELLAEKREVRAKARKR